MDARERLRHYLRRRRTNQAELAKVLGIDAATLSRVLNGKRPPTLRVAAALERETGIPAAAWAA